jgi:hypothetical protein
MECFYDGGMRHFARPEKCWLYVDYLKKDAGAIRYQWRSQRGRVITFVGRDELPKLWWFGTLNGRPAVGHVVNKLHFVFTSFDRTVNIDAAVKGY